ncbi:type II toxin-antitoxin system prevent-host-death family antitoxin [Spectribacter hydrogenoxidans]|uniref:Antitoxin n=1 Tax=Spectribacter hydrogenoxidans TaxID=3075608 RepID=A0ABU3C4H8_9GAMM|nr:type II toxin-antitoxin system prevent-host-death family antitoxin [Salinisphaera sp. W335]MDT0636244.1 type II toxin-antitoxin system prevent-host-death family antitoxin [Salinisphaera sp. W335]
MSELINIHKAKTHLSRLLARAHAGEEIILARAGKPYARLMPLEKAERRLGFMEGRVDDSFFDALPAEELDSWEGR